MMKTIQDILTLSKEKCCGKENKRKRLVVVCAEDEYVMDSVEQARKLGIVIPILIGNRLDIEEKMKMLKISCEEYEIVDVVMKEDAAKIAVKFIREGKADILMKGLLDTKVILKEVVNKETGIKKNKVLSHISVLEFPTLSRLLFVTDGAMVPYPTKEQKIELIHNGVSLLHQIGYDKPKVGIASSVEKPNPAIISSIDAWEIVEQLKEDERLDYEIDGPLAMDNLVSVEAAKHKGIVSHVAGYADLIVVPNIDAGNILIKTATFLSNAKSAGIVVGAVCPIVVVSRADSVDAKLASIALGVLLS